MPGRRGRCAAGHPAAGSRKARRPAQAILRARDEAFGPGAFGYPRPACDAAARAAIEESVAPGEDLGHDYVGTGHMLLGMLAGATVPPPGSSGSAGATVPPPGSSGSAGLGEASGRPLVLARIAERRE